MSKILFLVYAFTARFLSLSVDLPVVRTSLANEKKISMGKTSKKLNSLRIT